MKIGIGVITYNRPEHLKLFMEQLVNTCHIINDEYSGEHTYKLWTYEDKKQKGVAYGSNICLYNLRHCDHIFLFNDDCFPIHPDWVNFFVNSGQEHALYMNKDYSPFMQNEQICYYANASGVFMYLTKKAFNTVGYFNTEYGRFGFEHAAYSKRIFNAGLTLTNFPCLHNTNQYLHALDLDGTKGYEFLNHVSTITGEERTKCIKENDPIYIKETTSKQIYYDFKP